MRQKKMSNIHWNVYMEDFNQREIKTFDVFRHSSFCNDVEKLLKQRLSRDDFSRELKSRAMYYFWSKSEYEIVITSFPPHITKEELSRLNSEDSFYRYMPSLETGLKVDIYQQLLLNWDRFVDYVYNFCGQSYGAAI